MSYSLLQRRSSLISTARDEETNTDGNLNEEDFEEENELDEGIHYNPSWAALFSFLNPTGVGALACASILSIISGLLFPVMSVFMGSILDSFAKFGTNQVTAEDLVSDISFFSARLAMLGVATVVTSGAAGGMWTVLGELQACEARKLVLDGILRKELVWFDRRKKGIGAIVSKIQTQIKEFETAISENVGCVVQAFVIAITAFGIALWHSRWLTFVIMAGLPITFAILRFLSLKIGPLITTQKDHLSSATKSAHRAISAISTVKLLNGQDYELGIFSKAIHAAGDAYKSQAFIEAIQLGIVKFVLLGMFVQGFWFGGELLWKGEDAIIVEEKLTPGGVITTFWSCLIVVQHIQGMVPFLQGLEKGKMAAAGLKNMARKSTKQDGADGLDLGKLQGNINFHNVTFSYPTRPSQLALHKVSITIPSHKTTWIVGRSGSGKSTLATLILKAYAPTTGLITFGGRLLEQVDNQWLRENVTLVQQNSVLFNDTIFNNIALGKGYDEKGGPEEVRMALELVGGEDMLVDMKDHWHTLVGAGGKRLSGGQRQMIILARAILRDSPYLILDEAMSSIDRAKRKEILQAICSWRDDRTTLIITHDILPIPKDDYVWCLDAGNVVEHGTRRRLEEIPDGYFSDFMRTSKDIDNRAPGKDYEGSSDSQDEMEEHYLPSGGFSTSVDAGGSKSDGYDGERPLSPANKPLRRKLGNSPLDILPPNPQGLFEKPTFPGTPKEKQHEYTYIDLESIPLESGSSGKEKVLQPNPPKIQEVAFLTHYQILLTVWPMLRNKQRIYLIVGIIFAFVNAAATPLFSLALSRVLNVMIQEDTSREKFSKWTSLIFIAAIIDGIASFMTHYLLHYVGQVWADFHKIEGFRRILAQPQNWFDTPQNGVSGLIEDLEKHAEEMKIFVGQTVGHIFIATFMMVLGTTLALVYSWKLTLVAIAISPVVYLITRGLSYMSEKAEESSNQAAKDCGALMLEALENVMTVKFLGLERYFKRRYNRLVKKAWKSGLSRSVFDGMALGTGKAIMMFALALLFHFGGLLVAKGEYTVESIFRVFTLMSFCLANAAILLTMIPQVSNAKDTSRRVLRLSLNLPPTSHESHGILRPTRSTFNGQIQFQNTSFTYPTTSHPALQNINLHIPPGPSITYFTGHSGSGKSTLCTTLLTRLYPPSDGLIYLDSIPISRFNITRLRELICVVPQSPTLFPGLSVRENIFYGMGDESQYRQSEDGDGYDEHLESIARICDIHTFITTSLPFGYDTVLTQGGSGGGDGLAGGGCSLSGGQVRRIAMIRAMVRNPRVLVLDEPWCGLDVESERRVGEGVRRWAREKGVGVIVVTHGGGLGGGTGGELVVVMSEGRVVSVEESANGGRNKGGESGYA